MNNFKIISSYAKELGKEFKGVLSYQYKMIEEYSKMRELQNKVASLSNSSIAECLMDTLKRMAYRSIESNREFICRHLEEAIKDLLGGMDAIEMLHKYDLMLYEMQNNKCDNYQLRGHRAKCYIIDDIIPDDIKKGINESMVKMICVCDRCGTEIKGTTYYVVRIYGKDINPQSEYTTTYASAVQNVATNSSVMFNAEKYYCEKCKNEIEDFMKST